MELHTEDHEKEDELQLLVPKNETTSVEATSEDVEPKSPNTPSIPKLDLEHEELYENALSYSESIVSILIPVTITMLITIWAIQVLSPILYKIPLFASLAGAPSTGSAGYSIWLQLGLAAIYSVVFVTAIILVTFLLLCLYKLRWMFIIWGWFLFSTFLLLSFMGGLWFDFFLKAYKIKIDYVSFVFIMYIVGMISVFWVAPAIFNQIYLIMISSMAAWWLTRLPDWTILVLLIVVSFYDIFAVLTPKGPLKLLVEEAQERNEPLPGLLYEGKTLKLGLGDFVFYSVLVGKASMFDFTTCVVCIMAILFGLSCTLFILGMTRRALPALPISIFLGIIFFVLTRYVIMRMVIPFGLYRIAV